MNTQIQTNQNNTSTKMFNQTTNYKRVLNNRTL